MVAGAFCCLGVNVPANGKGDPALKTQRYRRNREIIRRKRWPCARCGAAIDYDGPRFVTVEGRRVENPWAFDCGHIIDRALGGSEELWNLQPEHVVCSRKAGAKLGARRRWTRRASITAAWW